MWLGYTTMPKTSPKQLAYILQWLYIRDHVGVADEN